MESYRKVEQNFDLSNIVYILYMYKHEFRVSLDYTDPLQTPIKIIGILLQEENYGTEIILIYCNLLNMAY